MDQGKPISLAEERAQNPELAAKNDAIKKELDKVVASGAAEQRANLMVDFDADEAEKALSAAPMRIKVAGVVYKRQSYPTAKYLAFTTSRLQKDKHGNYRLMLEECDTSEWMETLLGAEIYKAVQKAGHSAATLQKLMEAVVAKWETVGQMHAGEDIGGNGLTHA